MQCRKNVKLCSADLNAHKCLPLLFAEDFTTRLPHYFEDVDQRLITKTNGPQEFEHQVRVAEYIGPDIVLIRGAVRWRHHARKSGGRWKLQVVARVIAKCS